MVASLNEVDIVKHLYPFDYCIAGEGADKAVNVYKSFLPFQVHSYSSGEEINGWCIPQGWEVTKAQISWGEHNKYDAISQTPLGCAYLSDGFIGIVDKPELLKHLAWRDDLPNAVVYDWTRLYRQSCNSWGLCLPKTIIQLLPDTSLSVEINVNLYDAKMRVYDYVLKGDTEEEILINAHNCHPYQANDDISGCAVGIKVFNHLRSLKRRKYTYRLLIGPELFGPMFWLNDTTIKHGQIVGCILLKSVGNNAELHLQQSYLGVSDLDLAAKLLINSRQVHPFRQYYGNDETVFEAPGFEHPTITLTRYPFYEYHTSLDTPDKISQECLQQTTNTVLQLINILETNTAAKFVSKGLYCLSSPKYNLYRKAEEPGISQDGRSELDKRWNLLMNCLPRELAAKKSILEIATKFKLDYSKVLEYILEWQEKGLLFLDND